MRTYPKPPSEEEIALCKKLRLIGEFFTQLNASTHMPSEVHKAGPAARVDVNWLPPQTVEAINAYRAQNGVTNADLMAIRDAPGRWFRSYPHAWLWMLHCYTNKYSK